MDYIMVISWGTQKEKYQKLYVKIINALHKQLGRASCECSKTEGWPKYCYTIICDEKKFEEHVKPHIKALADKLYDGDGDLWLAERVLLHDIN